MSTPEVTPFHSQLPVKLSFGDGVIAELSDVLAALEVENAFVVVEAPVEGNDGLEAAIAACADDGIRIERYLKQSGEPTFEAADYVARAIIEGNCQAVVGIGGGSALDLAKAARLLADAGGTPWDYIEGGRPFAPPALPLVLCPTTSGTGSEVSGASVLTDTDRDRKFGLANGHMRAQHALVDPLLTLGLPPGPTAHSGVDALAQAIGACTVQTPWPRPSAPAPCATAARSRSPSASRRRTTSAARSSAPSGTARIGTRAGSSPAAASPAGSR